MNYCFCKRIVFGLFLSIGLIAGIEAFASENPSENVRIKFNVFPWEPVAGQTVEIQGEIVYIDGPYILKSVSQSLREGGLIVVDVIVEKAEIPSSPVVNMEPFHLTLGELPAGGYTVLAQVNGVAQYKMAFVVYAEPRPTPTPGPKPLLSDASILISPEMPSATDEIRIKVNGQFSNARYSIAGAKAEIRPDAILLWMDVQEAEIGAEVVTPISHEFNIGTMPPGGYAVILYVNGIEAAYNKFMVMGEFFPLPKPRTGPYSSRLWIEPPEPMDGVEFTVYLLGEFPSTGYTFEEKNIELTDNNTIKASVKIAEPDGPALTVMTPFREPLGTFTLKQGVYTALGEVNGVVIPEMIFKVIGDVPDDPIIIDPNTKSFVIFTREGGIAGLYNSVHIYNSGYFMRMDRIIDSYPSFSGQIPDELWVELQNALNTADFSAFDSLYKPDSAIADGFAYTIAYGGKDVVIQQGSAIPETLQTILSLLEKVLSLSTDLPADDPVTQSYVVYTREGGFAGLYDSVSIYSSGYFMRGDSVISSRPSVSGKIPEDLWKQLQDALNAADFSAYEPVYKPEFNVADGFTYTIAYGGKKVVILQEAAIPETLQTMQALLEKVLSLPGDQDQGEGGIVNFNRSGGFAGENSQLNLSIDGNFKSNSVIAGNISNNSGAAPADLMEQLRQSLNQTDFSALPPVNKPENAIADGYVYTLNYLGNEIVVYQGAAISAPLQETIELLERILNLSNRDDLITKVESWILY